MATKKAEEQPADHDIQSDQANSNNHIEDRGIQGGNFSHSTINNPVFNFQLNDKLNTPKTDIALERKRQRDIVIETDAINQNVLRKHPEGQKIKEKTRIETEEERLNATPQGARAKTFIK